ncbi:MAG: DoxX family protein [Thermomicrobiales bacterium]
MQEHATAPLAERFLDPILFGRGMAVLRIFLGLVLFANGLAKLLERTRIEAGWYRGNLVGRQGARNILDFEVNRRDDQGTSVPGLKRLVNDLILPNWDIFQWVVTFLELGVGAFLILGLASRLAALGGLVQMLFLAAVYFSSNRWMFEQPHEYVPLIILSLVPAGRVWGFDEAIVQRFQGLSRWPF